MGGAGSFTPDNLEMGVMHLGTVEPRFYPSQFYPKPRFYPHFSAYQLFI